MFKSITGYQERDTCMALVFLLLLIWFFYRQAALVYASMALLLLGMIWPAAMRPLAFVWYGLAMLMGKVVSSILLGIVWLVLVVPVGLARRFMGKDSLRLKQWRDGSPSAFVVRDHVYEAADMKNPY